MEAVSIANRLWKIQGAAFKYEGATLEEKQASLRKNLAVGVEAMKPLLEEDLSVDDRLQAAALQLKLLKLLMKAGEAERSVELEAALQGLAASDEPRLRTLGEEYAIMFSLDGVSTLEPALQVKRIDAAIAYVLGQAPTKKLLQFAVNCAAFIEPATEYGPAAKAHQKLAEHFLSADDPALEKGGKKFQLTAKRLSLPGMSMELTGTTMEGKSFDVKQLKGKVILVDFWATWCGPCIAEFPKMKDHYAKYQSHGFEIVGVSIDENREHLQHFLDKNEIPWIILHEEGDEEKQGWKHPVAKQYGISAVPCMILIDADGNVITTQARGEELERRLESLFPGVESSES
ncbi:TlpA family protein disulfide reductase [Blastopirellula sp. J2-11]|uniref:TlpA family protein disulfide reductase n=1 Tax=Blastopirellula sp. J2-11 TaxID=2943192 RepID=UPI0021C76DA8|nr:TlpA disulfide reductase family protein [Blastopirellula sp. J2-11]UUO06997.1 TlpA family protein disulfide reductase [Blastopirellula sp. J2-11]